MGLLESITSPRDLGHLGDADLDALATEIRDFLVLTCSRTGGHLGPNLGVVELTMALHRVFESPSDRIVFDTGHQAYVHKLLTGRMAGFDRLRQEGGVSGYPSQAESDHDIVENSHASTALSYADGLAKAYRLRGEQRHVVAVIGDGALTGGMAWEALNNIAVAKDSRLVIVVNDNERSYTPTVGGLATALSSLRTNPRYEQVLDVVKKRLNAVPRRRPGGVRRPARHEEGHEGRPRAAGPLRGPRPEVRRPRRRPRPAGRRAGPDPGQAVRRPVIVHALTRKGYGYDAAEQHVADQFHSPGPFDLETGEEVPKSRIWTDVFADEIVHIGERRQDVVAITAAMMHPVGLHHFEAGFPERTFDVGIAEQHAATSAAGLAMGGMHPVVAVYATFLNRAFDQVLMDVALHRCGVTFVLDRAGVTGDDGASHNGMWDMSVLQVVPGLRLAAPRDAHAPARAAQRGRRRRRRAHRRALPQGRRRPTTSRPSAARAAATCCCADGTKDVLIVGVGAMAPTAVEVGRPAGRPGHRRHRRRPALGQAGRPGPARARAARTGWSSRVEDNGDRRRLRRRAPPGPQRRPHHDARAPARHSAAVPRPRQASGHPRAHRPDAAEPRARGIVEDITAAAGPARALGPLRGLTVLVMDDCFGPSRSSSPSRTPRSRSSSSSGA